MTDELWAPTPVCRGCGREHPGQTCPEQHSLFDLQVAGEWPWPGPPDGEDGSRLGVEAGK